MSIAELLAIYTSQTMGNTSLPRFASFSTDGLKFVSYFGGDMSRDMAILVLEENEDANLFRKPLINFYKRIINGEAGKINVEVKFEELFDIFHEHHKENKAQFQSIEVRFDTYLDLFRDFVEVLDARMSKLENNILKLTKSLITGECRGS